MFWPQIYNELEHILCRIADVEYKSEITTDVYRANRNNPFLFNCMSIQNYSQYPIIPRTGVKCYEVPDTNKIYILGGFYTNQDNYLKFQTDITIMDYNESQIVMINSVPKSFYYDFEAEKPNRIKKIKNDVIRPRI